MPGFVKDIEELRRRALRHIENGPVIDSSQPDREETIRILNEALATEIVCVLRYMHHYFMSTGVHGAMVAQEFKEHADSEREHADSIAARIQQLRGKPDFNPGTLVSRSAAQYIEGETLGDMIREDLIAERMVIQTYSEVIRYFGDNDPTTRVMFEDILQDEEEHAADLADMLFIVEPSTGRAVGVDPGTDALAIHHGDMKEGLEIETAASGELKPELVVRSGQQRPEATAPSEHGARTDALGSEEFAGRGSAPAKVVREEEASSEPWEESESEAQDIDETAVLPAHPPGTTGHPKRERPQQTEEAETATQPEGGQGGATRAVRVTKPNRKRRIA